MSNVVRPAECPVLTRVPFVLTIRFGSLASVPLGGWRGARRGGGSQFCSFLYGL